MLRDFFIIGINDHSILWKLLTDSVANLAKVMEIAIACMQTAKSLCVSSNKSKVIQQDPSVNKITFGYKQKCFSKPLNSPPPPDISESTQNVGVPPGSRTIITSPQVMFYPLTDSSHIGLLVHP